MVQKNSNEIFGKPSIIKFNHHQENFPNTKKQVYHSPSSNLSIYTISPAYAFWFFEPTKSHVTTCFSPVLAVFRSITSKILYSSIYISSHTSYTLSLHFAMYDYTGIHTHTHIYTPLYLVRVLLFVTSHMQPRWGHNSLQWDGESFQMVRAKKGHRDPQDEKESALCVHYFTNNQNFMLQRLTLCSVTPVFKECLLY